MPPRKPAGAEEPTDPAVEAGATAEDPEVTALRAELAVLRRQQAQQIVAAQVKAQAEDPDILGLPGIKPLRLVTGDDDEDEAERVPIFYIDGTEYTIPTRVSFGVAAEYLHRAVTNDAGEVAAIEYLLGEMLGAEGYAALRGYKKLTSQQYGQVVLVCTRMALGALETPKA